MPDRVLIAGYYGYGNSGDEAILGGMLADLRQACPEAAFTVVSGDPDATRQLHGVDVVSWADLAGLVEAVRRSSLIIVGGGGLFHDYWGVDPAAVLTERQAGIGQYAAPIVLAQMMGKPSLLYAVGVGPLRTPEGRAITRDVFAAADAVTVRDAGSRAVLADLGCNVARVEIVPDPAFHLPRGDDVAVEGALRNLPRPVLGVALRPWAFGVGPEAWQGEVAAALDAHLGLRGGTALFVPMQDGEHEVEDDVAVSRAVMARMACGGQAALAPSQLDPLQRFRLLERCDAVLGMRMHALVAALRGGAPVVALAYDPKVTALMEAAGLGAWALPPEQWEPGLIAERLRGADGVPGAGVGCLKEWCSRAGESARLAARLLAEGLPEPAPAEAALRRAALEKVLAVQSLEALARRLEGRLAEQAEEMEALRRRGAAELAEALHEASRAQGEAARSQAAQREAEGEQARIRSSKGWRLLGSAWRLVWLARERLGFLGSAAARALSLLIRPTRAVRSAARGLRPRWLRRLAFASGPGAYGQEDNSTVVLYTDRAELYPDYQPRRPLSAGSARRVPISLVVTVKNEGRTAAAWLLGLSQQLRAPDEVIILDNGSSDDTMDVIGAFAAESDLRIRLERRPGENIAACRNSGVKMAEHDVIAMTDFGCDLNPRWLQRLAVPFESQPDTQVVAGGYDARLVGNCSEHFTPELVPTIERVDPRDFLPATRSMGFRKDAWRAVGGFPEWLSHTGEDTYFALELKRLCPRWAFVPEARVAWHVPEGIAGFWQKLAGWASGDGESGARAGAYRRGLRVLALLCAGGSLVLGGIGVAAAGWLSARWIAPVGVGLILLVGATFAFRGRTVAPRSLPWSFLGLHARSIGYLRGVRNRPVVAQRRHAGVAGIRFVLSGVPIDDSGGGQRGAQMAREWLRLGHLVVFLHRFPKNESRDLHLPVRHPRLLHWSLEEFDWQGFRWEYGRLLEEKSVLALVELPLPEFVPVARAIHRVGGRVVYDLIDDWRTSLAGRWYSPFVEKKIAMEADVLVATAPLLARYLEELSGRNVLLLPNAVDTELFDPTIPHSRPADLPTARPAYIYVGSLWGDWFDWDLLLRVARASPNASVVVIGDYRGQCPGSAPNLHFLGLKPQSELPAYLAHADVGILPWKRDVITASTSPLKVYEYLAMGLPVVAPDLEPLPQHRLVLRAADAEGFIVALAQASALRTHPSETAAFRLEHGWQERADELERAAEALRSGRSSKGETANSG
jgi:polysaccharide pyruvyl transferase CsaB